MNAQDVLQLRDDLAQHLKKAHADLRRLADENIQTVVNMSPTPELREAFFELNVHLAACLDYIGNYVREHWCAQSSDPNTPRPYFLCSNIYLKQQRVELRVQTTFPDLINRHPALYQLILTHQPRNHKLGKTLEELRLINNAGKHIKLIPPTSVEQLQGTTVHRYSGIPEAPPLWVWAKEAHLGPESHLLGGNGSILGFGSLSGAPTADVLGLSLENILQQRSTPEVKIYPFLCLWFAEGISMPLLQFSGTATNIVSEIVLRFLEVMSAHTPDMEIPTPPTFYQVFANECLTNNGTITTLG